jgi:hypothetical protein
MKRKLNINDLTKAEKKKLVKEICRICEKQYRKGYQHGFTDGKENLVTKEQVNNFRGKGIDQNYSKVVYPPDFKNKINPVRRVFDELAMPEMELLQALFSEFENNK